MLETPLSRQLGALRAWQTSQVRLLQRLQSWLQRHGLATTQAQRAIGSAIDALHDERLTVAVAGEFSRGKTELLNALFFADLGCRLLPTDAGRTTMCPTEIAYTPDVPPQLRLLPIETRAEAVALSALRADPSRWHVVDIDADDPDVMAATLGMLTERQQVDRDSAASLGLLGDASDRSTQHVTIPRWRLAQLNIRHPLLERGLRILDTPGLNAIGSEPELTYEMLPAAHALLFVLGADTGVTQSDLEIWRQFVHGAGRVSRPGVTVVLNKTDTLWDDLRTSHQVAASIFDQCRNTARTLAVDEQQVFAVSAQKALLARVKGDQALERRSGVAGLERHLGETILDNRIALIRERHTQRVLQATAALQTTICSRLERNDEQRRNLLDLANRSDAAIVRLLQAAQSDYARYNADLDIYRRNLLRFRRHAQRLLDTLDPAALDDTLRQIHRRMTGAWTTAGLRSAMRTLFDVLDRRIEQAGGEAQRMRRLLRETYRHFEKQHRFQTAHPSMLSIVRHQVELSLLDQEAEIFRNSPRTTLMEQHFVTKRYFGTIVARVRRIMDVAHDEARQWSETVMSPLSAEIHAYRDGVAQQIDDLQQTAGSRQTIQRRIDALRRDNARLRAQIGALNKLDHKLAQGEQRVTARASGQN
ncbi:MAG: dynamin family protein [Gammaproteobacteria bacterium]|nr:dynamin family protein [Gammaproteobacteria bacterium]